MGMDKEHCPNPILEASLGYAGSLGCTLLTEVNLINECIDTRVVVNQSHNTQLESFKAPVVYLEDVVQDQVFPLFHSILSGINQGK